LERLDLFELALSDVRRRVWRVEPLQRATRDDGTGRLGE
jgi:hypothetical protein